MNLFAIHAGAVKTLQGILGDDCPKLFFNGELINIIPGSVKLKREAGPGGLSLDADISITCLAEYFKTLPEPKQTFYYPGQKGTHYRITGVDTMPTGLQLRIIADEFGKL